MSMHNTRQKKQFFYTAIKDVRIHPKLVLMVYPARQRSAVAPQLRTLLEPRDFVVLPSGQVLHGLLLAEDEYFPTSQIMHDPAAAIPYPGIHRQSVWDVAPILLMEKLGQLMQTPDCMY
jgi:hypothetical protein